jgi:hypothetical protein
MVIFSDSEYIFLEFLTTKLYNLQQLLDLYTLAWDGSLYDRHMNSLESEDPKSPFDRLQLLVSNFSRQEMTRRLTSVVKRVEGTYAGCWFC